MPASTSARATGRKHPNTTPPRRQDSSAAQRGKDESTTTVQDEPSSPQRPDAWEHARREGARLGKRWRRQCLPLAVIGGTHAFGAAAAALSGPTALAPVAVGWGGAAAAYGHAARHASRWNRVYTAVAALGSAGWEATAALSGADGLTSGLLWGGGAVLALPWWVRHAEPEPDITAERAAGKPAPLPPASSKTETCAPDPRAVTWGRHLAGNGGALPGSKLTDFTDFTHGWKATVQLPIGQHWHQIMGVRKAILSVLDLPDGRVFVEAIPGASVRTARLTVLTTDPLQQVVRWIEPGLDPQRGTFPLMTTADGSSLPFRFWWPGGGAAHALVSGVNGSGKTKVLDLILTEAGCSDRIVPFVIDGGGGASLPHWANRVPRAAETRDDARTLLRYVLALMERRRVAIKRQGGGSLEPSPHMPLICVVIDEAHKLLMNDEVAGVDNSEIRRMCEILTQEGRKFGISLVLATQVPSAKQLGGSTVLRDQLKGGTVVGLRVTERTSGNMISSGAPMPEGLHELPAVFPDGSPTRGLGYVLTSRMIRARSLLIEHPETQPLTDVALDADSAAEPAPALTGQDEPSEPLSGEGTPQTLPAPWQSGDGDIDPAEVIEAVIAEGTHPDPVSLMHVTGLSLRQVRHALAARTAKEETRDQH